MTDAKNPAARAGADRAGNVEAVLACKFDLIAPSANALQIVWLGRRYRLAPSAAAVIASLAFPAREVR
jgi:hypothetical protein